MKVIANNLVSELCRHLEVLIKHIEPKHGLRVENAIRMSKLNIRKLKNLEDYEEYKNRNSRRQESRMD